MRLLIAGGGTGGHLFPALAVARALRAEFNSAQPGGASAHEPSGDVLLVGRAGGPEERVVPQAGFELATIRVQGLDRDAWWKNLALPAVLPAALRAGLRIVDRFKPDVVLGMGGYVMAPAVAAARMRGIPYVLHEKDERRGLHLHHPPRHREAAGRAPHRGHRRSSAPGIRAAHARGSAAHAARNRRK